VHKQAPSTLNKQRTTPLWLH